MAFTEIVMTVSEMREIERYLQQLPETLERVNKDIKMAVNLLEAASSGAAVEAMHDFADKLVDLVAQLIRSIAAFFNIFSTIITEFLKRDEETGSDFKRLLSEI